MPASIPTLTSFPVGNNKPGKRKGNIVALPKLEPLQGHGEAQYGKNGRPGQRNLMSQINGSGGGIHGHVIEKALSREQKQDVGVSAGLGAALNAGSIRRSLRYGKEASAFKRQARESGTKSTAGVKALGQSAQFAGLRNRNVAAAALGTSIGAGAVAGVHTVGNKRRERQFAKAAPVMGDPELRRRKKLQANISIATSTIGLGALGAKGAGGVLRKVGRVKGADRADKIANHALIGGAGLGGVGGFNFAATQKAEARKRNVGVPVKKAYEPEKKRLKRLERTERGLDATSNGALATAIGGGAALGAREGARAGLERKLKARTTIPATVTQIPVQRKVDGRYQQVMVERPVRAKRVGTLQGEARATARGRLKKVNRLPGMTKGRGAALGGLAALGVGGKVAADRLESYRHGSGSSHRPRYGR